MSGFAVSRDDWWVRVEDKEAGLAVHGVKLQSLERGLYNVTIDLDGNDEVLLHRGDIELYVSLDRLSDLAEMLGAFVKEAKLMAKEDDDG